MSVSFWPVGGSSGTQGFPIIEMYIGELGISGQSTEGVFARIPTPELMLRGDKVYFRHRANRSTSSNNANTRLGKTSLMRVINNNEGADVGGNVWYDVYPPIDPSKLSIPVGQDYRWVKVGEVPSTDLIKVPDGRFYWAGNHRTRSKFKEPSEPAITRRHRNFTVMDIVIIRDGNVVAKSQQYLLTAVGADWGYGNEVEITYKEI